MNIPPKKIRKDYTIPDELWNEIEPLIPEVIDTHPLGCHRPRVSNRSAMNAIFFVLKTGSQWNSLSETKICSSSSAHRRFQEWVEAGLFEKLWKKVLRKYDELKGLDFSFCSTDGAITKAPLGGKKDWQKPSRQS
jgi:transposase